MSISDDMERSYKEEEEYSERQRAKMGPYTGDACPNCRRHRVMKGQDEKRRCEKCAWCIDDAGYDGEFSDYIR